MKCNQSRIWTRVAVSNSCDDNNYTTGTSNQCIYIRFYTYVFSKINATHTPLERPKLCFVFVFSFNNIFKKFFHIFKMTVKLSWTVCNHLSYENMVWAKNSEKKKTLSIVEQRPYYKKNSEYEKISTIRKWKSKVPSDIDPPRMHFVASRDHFVVLLSFLTFM